MNTIEKIRAEIKRLKLKNPSEYNYQNAEGYIWGLDDVLSFLDTLQEQEVDLDEAADAYVGNHPEIDEGVYTYAKRLAFKAGAKKKGKDCLSLTFSKPEPSG